MGRRQRQQMKVSVTIYSKRVLNFSCPKKSIVVVVVIIFIAFSWLGTFAYSNFARFLLQVLFSCMHTLKHTQNWIKFIAFHKKRSKRGIFCLYTMNFVIFSVLGWRRESELRFFVAHMAGLFTLPKTISSILQTHVCHKQSSIERVWMTRALSLYIQVVYFISFSKTQRVDWMLSYAHFSLR